MDSTGWITATGVVVVAGKGGVGKTTVSAALARAAAAEGASVLVVSVDGRSGLAGLLGGPGVDPVLTYEPAVLFDEAGQGTISGRALRPEDAFFDYLDDKGLARHARRFSRGALELLAATTPGLKDLLVLGKIKQLELARDVDLIVVDAPAAGHAVTFLRSPRALADVVSVGPIRAQAVDVGELLADATRCQVVLVTLPEETPVNEVVETAFDLEDELGLHLAPVVVNGCWPERRGLAVDLDAALAGAAASMAPAERSAVSGAVAFTSARVTGQRAQLARLAATLPLPQVLLPRRLTPRLGPEDVGLLAGALTTTAVTA